MSAMTLLPPVALLFLLSFSLASSRDCPLYCNCQDNSVIFCIGRSSTKVPSGVPADTKKLYIFQNGISTLAQDNFSGLEQLDMLDLSQNELTQVPDGVFEPLSELKNLDLSSNHITNISKGIFSGLHQLERLYLYSNRIQSIQADAFEGLGRLLELKLQKNRLTTLPLLRLPRLLLLDLSFNRIPALGPADLQTPNLEALKIVSLGLTSLDEELMASFKNLHDLDISSNQLFELPVALKSLKMLISLDLANNPIRVLKMDICQKMVGLQKLDLSGLSLPGFTEGFFQSFPKLSHLTVAKNPFNCLCPLAWFPVWLRERNIVLGRPEETRCHFPLVNARKKLSELEYHDFGCPSTTTVVGGYPIESTAVPFSPSTAPEATNTNAIPPPPSSEEPNYFNPNHHPRLIEPPVSPSASSREREQHICPGNICLNGGTCHFDPLGQLACTCPRGTYGLYCENMDEVFVPPKSLVTEFALMDPVATSEPDAIISRTVTSTSILLDLHRFIETRPHIRGIRLTYRNLSGPDRRPMVISVPANYPEYTLRGLRPNCTYSVCASPLGERVSSRANGSAETGLCTEARTAGLQPTSSEPRVETQSQLTYTLFPAVAALALVLGVSIVAGAIICLRKRRQTKAGIELELGPTELDPAELEAVKAGLESRGNGTLPQKLPEIDRSQTPHSPASSQQNGVLEYEVPLMQGHSASNNNVAASKPSYF
ncbi:vasorin-like [Gadus morhua]|uniref:Vasorin a n=1 Tax=Gadus morhua TaxID=8049 RepID=A0A8C5FHP2_GADMO|nr:vasorin-like [Gadus morhua]